jgi:hypothetical protein
MMKACNYVLVTAALAAAALAQSNQAFENLLVKGEGGTTIGNSASGDSTDG